MNRIFALTALILSASTIASAAPKAKPAPTVGLYTAEALQEAAEEAVRRNRDALLAKAALQVKNFLPACSYPAGMTKRIAQLEALKASDLKPVGFSVSVRDKSASYEPGLPQVLHIEFFFEIPAGNGYPATVLGTALQSQEFAHINAKQLVVAKIDRHEHRDIVELQLLKVRRMPLSNDIILPALSESSPMESCNVSAKYLEGTSRL